MRASALLPASSRSRVLRFCSCLRISSSTRDCSISPFPARDFRTRMSGSGPLPPVSAMCASITASTLRPSLSSLSLALTSCAFTGSFMAGPNCLPFWETIYIPSCPSTSNRAPAGMDCRLCISATMSSVPSSGSIDTLEMGSGATEGSLAAASSASLVATLAASCSSFSALALSSSAIWSSVGSAISLGASTLGVLRLPPIAALIAKSKNAPAPPPKVKSSTALSAISLSGSYIASALRSLAMPCAVS